MCCFSKKKILLIFQQSQVADWVPLFKFSPNRERINRTGLYKLNYFYCKEESILFHIHQLLKSPLAEAQ